MHIIVERKCNGNLQQLVIVVLRIITKAVSAAVFQLQSLPLSFCRRWSGPHYYLHRQDSGAPSVSLYFKANLPLFLSLSHYTLSLLRRRSEIL